MILKPSSLNPPKPFAALNVNKKTLKKRCPSSLSKERIVLLELVILPDVGVVHLITVPLAIDRVMKIGYHPHGWE
jgi:hypothetical protein